jgi:hypothetical protein
MHPPPLSTTLHYVGHHSKRPGPGRWLSAEPLSYINLYFKSNFVKSKKFRTRIIGSNPEFWTGTSGTFVTEPSELSDWNLENFLAGTSRTSRPEPAQLSEISDWNL